MTGPYLSLIARIDRFAASVHARYPMQMTCHPTCAECCQAGLTLVMVEAIAVGRALGIEVDRILLQAGQPPLHTEGKCALLGPDNLCRAYEARPIICRTHGLPLLYPDQEGLTICEKNFHEVTPHNSAILDMSAVETALFAANLDFCRRHGYNPSARVAIDRLASLIPPDE